MTEIALASFTPRAAAAVMASANTNATDETDATLWGAALALETAAYERLTDAEREALYLLDRFLTALDGLVAVDSPPRYRAGCAIRLGVLL